MNPFSSKFDAWQAGKCQLTEEEKLGYELLVENYQGLEKVFGKTDFYLMQSVNVRKKATIAVSSS